MRVRQKVAAGSLALLVGCSNPGSAPTTVPSTTSTSVVASTTTSLATTTTLPRAQIPIADPDSPSFEVVFSVPAGEGGVTVRRGGADQEMSGPAAFTVDEAGGFWIADTIGVRLLRFSATGELITVIDTDAVGVGPLIDLVPTPGGVWGLEAVPALERYRLVYFSTDGTLLDDHELPDGLKLSDGLSGISTTPTQTVVIEVAGGVEISEAFSGDAFEPTRADGWVVSGVLVKIVPGDIGSSELRVGDAEVSLPYRTFGGFGFEGVVEGALGVLHSDVGSADDGSLDVDVSFLWLDLEGEVVGIADFPLEELSSTWVPNDYIATGSDGTVYGMIARPDGIEVVRLNVFAPSGA